MMLRKTLAYAAVLACSALALADDKKDDKDKPALAGTWARQGAELQIEFADKEVLKIYPHGDKDVITVVCKYTLTKDKRVKATITELEGKAKEKAKDAIPVGLEFSFTWQAKGDVATLDDVAGKNVELLKSHLEGKYEPKK
jgi:hypothetical protein